jgi:DUF1365 family protein
MDHFVPLERLPDGLRFPPELGDRVHYDAEHHRLVYRGFMSKVDFDRLCALSDDWAFRRPLEDLFRLCTPEAQAPRPGALRRAFAALTSRGPGRLQAQG